MQTLLEIGALVYLHANDSSSGGFEARECSVGLVDGKRG
jgi:hypothetical protein